MYSLTLPCLHSAILEVKIGSSSASLPLHALVHIKGCDLLHRRFHEVKGRGRRSLNLKTNPATRSRVHGGSVGLVTLWNSASGSVMTARGARRGGSGENGVAEGCVGEGLEIRLAL
ncbi:hypothetical protein CR513_52201, partial [Mucuna pruriens]